MINVSRSIISLLFLCLSFNCRAEDINNAKSIYTNLGILIGSVLNSKSPCGKNFSATEDLESEAMPDSGGRKIFDCKPIKSSKNIGSVRIMEENGKIASISVATPFQSEIVLAQKISDFDKVMESQKKSEFDDKSVKTKHYFGKFETVGWQYTINYYEGVKYLGGTYMACKSKIAQEAKAIQEVCK